MNESTRALVRARAHDRCEYCGLHQVDSPLARMHVDHIIPRQHGGSDDDDNLALSCVDCNLHKGTNLTGIDPLSGQITVLFHPRRHDWDDHFEWRGLYVVGMTAIGRTTVRLLAMNSADQVDLRSI